MDIIDFEQETAKRNLQQDGQRLQEMLNAYYQEMEAQEALKDSLGITDGNIANDDTLTPMDLLNHPVFKKQLHEGIEELTEKLRLRKQQTKIN
jgi:hypothetical protein